MVRGAGKEIWTGTLATVLGGVILWGLPKTAEEATGQPIAIVLGIGGGFSAFALIVLFNRYLAILGHEDGDAARAYRRLWKSLHEGGAAAELYSRWLTQFLNGIARFFRDDTVSGQSRMGRLFGLRDPGPLWTAPSFDRCLSLALIVPIATILLIWAASGHVGPAEAALELRVDMTTTKRILAVAAILGAGVGMFAAVKISGWWLLIPIGLGGLSGFAIFQLLGIVAAAAILLAIWGALLPLFGLGMGTGALVLATPIVYGSVLPAAAWVIYSIVDLVPMTRYLGNPDGGVLNTSWLVGVVAGGVVYGFCDFAREKGRLTIFLVLLVIGLTGLCLAVAAIAASFATWFTAGPILLFFGLLPLVNAPFDWFSLGLTRALLKRGLELRGWWPYVLALVDALCAAVIVTVLAITMVIVVQAFDVLALIGGAQKPTLDLQHLFDGIANNPGAPEFWWLYGLLITALAPSIANLVIGGTSLVRGLPGVPALLLPHMPYRKPVARIDRHWIALVLTAQWAVGGILGIAAQALLVVGFVGYIMPATGLGVLELAHEVAALNLPLRIYLLLIGQPV